MTVQDAVLRVTGGRAYLSYSAGRRAQRQMTRSTVEQVREMQADSQLVGAGCYRHSLQVLADAAEVSLDDLLQGRDGGTEATRA